MLILSKNNPPFLLCMSAMREAIPMPKAPVRDTVSFANARDKLEECDRNFVLNSQQ